MTETGILMGAPPSSSTATLGASAVVLVVLLAGVLIVVLACLRQPRDAPAEPYSRGWQWAWAFVFLVNLPIPLIFGSEATEGVGRFTMLAGVAVVWLIGHFIVSRVSAIRAQLLVGGLCVAISQGFPIAHVLAGLMAFDAVGVSPVGTLSPPASFAVTLLTAALLAVAALTVGFALHAIAFATDKLSVRKQM